MEARTCKQSVLKLFELGRQERVYCDLPIESVDRFVKACQNCGTTDGNHRAMDCARYDGQVEMVEMRQRGMACANGHWLV